MKARHKKATGGVVEKNESPRDTYAGAESNVRKEADERKSGGRVKRKEGGKVEGKMSKMRLDRPGRKAGGRVGADKSPLSSAATMTNPPGRTAEC